MKFKSSTPYGIASRLLGVAIIQIAAVSIVAPALAGGLLDKHAGQLIVAVAPNWDTHRGTLSCYERTSSGWKRVVFRQPVPVLFGRSGLAWGRGAIPIPDKGRVKREGDRRAPAVCFSVGKVFGYAGNLPRGARYPYRQVGKWDAWVDDVRNPYYNRHIVVDPRNVPPWFEKQRMRLGDFAYKWLIEIRHNADPPKPGFGSAIFFHIRRGPDRPTSGCTTMEEANLEKIIAWLRADKRPHYVLLPALEYRKKQRAWGLPAL